MKPSKKKICVAMNTKGKKCIVPVLAGTDYCFRHQDGGKKKDMTKNQKQRKP